MAHTPPQQPAAYERLPDEGEAPWLAFEHFRLAGPGRTIAATAKALGRAHQTYREYSMKFRWRERALAWDEELARAKDQAVISESKRIAAEQLQAWRAARALGTTAIARALKAAKTNPDTAPASLRDAVALLEKATMFERLIMGEATSREESRHVNDFSGLSDEEADELLELAGKAGLLN